MLERQIPLWAKSPLETVQANPVDKTVIGENQTHICKQKNKENPDDWLTAPPINTPHW